MKTEISYDELINLVSPVAGARTMVTSMKRHGSNEVLDYLGEHLQQAIDALVAKCREIERANPDVFTVEGDLAKAELQDL